MAVTERRILKTMPRSLPDSTADAYLFDFNSAKNDM